MTGTVTWEVLIWVVGLIVAAGVGVATFLFWVWRIVSDLKKSFDDELQERDTAAGLESERAKIVEAELRRELSEFQIRVAEHYHQRRSRTGGREGRGGDRAAEHAAARYGRAAEHAT